MLNPFIICNVAEQALYRQYANEDMWYLACRALHALPSQIDVYNQDAVRYARTTLYPNEDVVAYARKIAYDMLLRGEPMPSNAEQAIEIAERRRLQEIVERCR